MRVQSTRHLVMLGTVAALRVPEHQITEQPKLSAFNNGPRRWSQWGGGVGRGCSSNAPLSIRLFTTRSKPGPRWS